MRGQVNDLLLDYFFFFFQRMFFNWLHFVINFVITNINYLNLGLIELLEIIHTMSHNSSPYCSLSSAYCSSVKW